MTELLFRLDPYGHDAQGTVLSSTPEGIVLDRTLFYPRAGGQPGDSGTLRWGTEAGFTHADITEATKGPDGNVLHVPAKGAELPPVGSAVIASLDWNRRHRHMRMHTALHLLCAVMPGIYATGNQIGAEKSRLDFDLPEPPTKEWLTERLNALIAADHKVSERWITEAELDANPGLVRTLSVQPPRGAGQIRLVCIGPEDLPVDLQPCGGTHVRSTGEIGGVEVTKLESKGRQNRRVTLVLKD
ncbi:alanyl-tRNA editing protein [Roseomonas elaeocarpi]|uniref:Alanine--tRNA ligase n=1 Tax=Roseomonas elaeocarpi TaxID=907779 RepID=A0ABV6JQZ0_9PROT